MELDKKLSDDEKINLIKELEKYPCLWDTSKAVYKNRQTRVAETEDLSIKFILTPVNLKKVCHTLRTGLSRFIKLYERGGCSLYKSKGRT
jgi:hypothetical protein